MNKQLLFIALLLVITSCTKEEIIVKEVEKTNSWKVHSKFTGLGKIKINSIATDKYLFLYGPEFLSTINKQNEVLHYFTHYKYPEYYRLPISASYFIKTYNEYIIFQSSDYPVVVYDNQINLKQLEPNFKGIDYGQSYQRGGISINNQNQCLVPIFTEPFNNKLTAFIFNVSIKDEYFVVFNDTIKVSLEYTKPYPFRGVIFAKAIENYFILSMDGITYKVYQNGDSKVIFNKWIDNIFLHNGKLYALREFNELYISEDKGETWLNYNNFPRNLIFANYYSIGDSLIASSRSKLYSLTINSNQIKINELINDGLEGNDITSLSEFNDSIYASTYSGVFLKHKKDLFKHKVIK